MEQKYFLFYIWQKAPKRWDKSVTDPHTAADYNSSEGCKGFKGARPSGPHGSVCSMVFFTSKRIKQEWQSHGVDFPTQPGH